MIGYRTEKPMPTDIINSADERGGAPRIDTTKLPAIWSSLRCTTVDVPLRTVASMEHVYPPNDGLKFGVGYLPSLFLCAVSRCLSSLLFMGPRLYAHKNPFGTPDGGT